MPSDRVVGLLCLGVAALTATWGGGFGEDETRPRSPRATSVAGAAETRAASEDGPETTSSTASSTTTTTAPKTTTTTAKKPPTTTSTTPPVTTAASKEVDDALARRTLIGSADLPGGFVLVRQAPAEGAETDGPFERCLGPDAAALSASVRAKARSAEFGKSGTGSASSSSAVFADPASAEKVMKILDSPPAQTCLEELINARLARNPNLPENARGKLTALDPETLGDQTTGFRFEVMLPAEDVEDEPSEEEIPYIADFLVVRRDRVLALFEFGSLRRPFPESEARGVATSVIKRV